MNLCTDDGLPKQLGTNSILKMVHYPAKYHAKNGQKTSTCQHCVTYLLKTA